MIDWNRPAAGRNLAAAVLAAVMLLPASAGAVSIRQPLRFFEGRTEMVSVVRVMLKKPYRSRTLGSGRILPDGSLTLVQQVYDEGKPPTLRRWSVRQVAPGRYVGTMTEAAGPVSVSEVGGRYRFKFRMKGNLAIEQWVTPLPGGTSARTDLTVRKLGMRVATSTGTISRV